MFVSNVIRYMAMVLGDVLKPRAHGHVFCRALQFALWRKAFLSRKRRYKPVPEKIPARAGLRARRAIV